MANKPELVVQIEVQIERFDRALARYWTELGIEQGKVVRIQARLANEDLIRITAPKSLAQGRRAVLRDVSRAVTVIDPSGVHGVNLRQAILSGDYDLVQRILLDDPHGKWAGYRLERFSPTLHQSRRDKRGRVRRNYKVITLDANQHRAYVKQVQGHVGIARAGWASSGRHVGARIPQWVLKHDVEQYGRVLDQLHDKTKPSITMTNLAKGNSSVTGAKVRDVLRRRVSAMTRDINQMLAGRRSRYFP